MNENIFLSVLLVAAGMFFLIRNILHYKDEARMLKYLETSPKAKIWVAKLGIEKTAFLTKKIFLPAGILLAFIMVCAGIFSLFSPYL